MGAFRPALAAPPSPGSPLRSDPTSPARGEVRARSTSAPLHEALALAHRHRRGRRSTRLSGAAAARCLIAGKPSSSWVAGAISRSWARLRSETLPWPSPLTDAIPAILARRGQPAVAVLASGDPFFHGVGSDADGAPESAADEMVWPVGAARPSASSRRALAGHSRTAPSSRCMVMRSNASFRMCSLEARHPLPPPDATTPGKLAALLAARGFGQLAPHRLRGDGRAA